MITKLLVGDPAQGGVTCYQPGEGDIRRIKKTDRGFALVYEDGHKVHFPTHRVAGWETTGRGDDDDD